MKIRIFIIVFSILLIVGCSSSKDSVQRRNLMMPEKGELPRNSKYVGVKKSKTYANNKRYRTSKRY